MRMEKLKFRIGELAKKLNVERFVIRFWEKEFKLRTNRSHGGQRFYDERDLNTFQRIKELLYKQGFTIAGARKQLTEKSDGLRNIIASQKTTMDEELHHTHKKYDEKHQHVAQQLIVLRENLHKLKELL